MMAGSLVFGGSVLQWIDPITLTTVQAAACAVAAAVCAWIYDGGSFAVYLSGHDSCLFLCYTE